MAMRLMMSAMSGSRMGLRTITTTTTTTTTAAEAKWVRPKPEAKHRTRTIPKPITTGTPESDSYLTSEEYDLLEKEADRIHDQELEEAKKQFPEAFVDHDRKVWSLRDTRKIIY